ncbi:MAG: DNA alkylation repair protein [Candidatus Gastranaerophilales bacterium]|nr:DNA alkylation repair protein [Candidatus Gastranaerophilales bacterium]
MIKKIREKLLQESQPDYKKFSSGLIPNISNIIGVRIPVLRKIAKEIYNSSYRYDFITSNDEEYMEEIMLKGMVIGLMKDNPEYILEFVQNFIQKINNWAVCDTFCSGLKFTLKNKNLVWNFILPYLHSKDEFKIRFALVMILNYFIDEEYIDKVLKEIDSVKYEDYYSKMAAAWAVSVCIVKQPDITLKYMLNSKLDNWTFNKSIQKSLESYRIKKETKEILKKMRRN